MCVCKSYLIFGVKFCKRWSNGPTQQRLMQPLMKFLKSQCCNITHKKFRSRPPFEKFSSAAPHAVCDQISPKSVLYGVATISRLLKITGLFCKRALYKRLYSAKENYNFKENCNFKEPTNRSHPLAIYTVKFVASSLLSKYSTYRQRIGSASCSRG